MMKFWKLVLCVLYGWFPQGVSPQLTTSGQEQQNEAERLVRNLYYNTSSVTWKEAEIACNQDRNSSLLPLTTESDRNFVSAIRRKFHPGAIWVGDYKVLEDTFVPHDAEQMNDTDKCVAMTITTISKQKIGHLILFDLFTAPYCTNGFMALCACPTEWGTTTLNVKATQHSWSFYRDNHCGIDCQLWAPPYEEVTSCIFTSIVGKGNVTLTGLTSNLQVGFTYWVNVLARVVERPASDSDRIVECGYLLPYADNVVFGSCTEKRAFICEVHTDKMSYITTPDNGGSVETERQNYNNRQTDNQSANGLSVAKYAGIVSSSIVVLLSAVFAFLLWRKCRLRRTNNGGDFKPNGGRSFVRQTTRPCETDFTEATDVTGTDAMEDNHVSMYAKIDPTRIRNTLEPPAGSQRKQPDIIPYTVTNGYLPMDGFQKAAFKDTYDVIENKDRALDGNYVEVHQHLKDNDVSNLASASYSVSMEMDEESVYDSTLDRHPSKRTLITGNNYDRLNFTQSGSMDGNIFNSVNIEDGNYSNHHSIKLHNPTYDRVVIN